MKQIVGVSVLLAILGWLLAEPRLTAFALMILGFGYAAFDLRRALHGRMSALALLGFFYGLGGAADLVGLMSVGKPWEGEFFIYALKDYLPEAETLMYVGTAAMIAGYWWSTERAGQWKLLPAVGAEISAPALPGLAAAVALACAALMSSGVDLGGSTFGDLFRMAPAMAAFFLARLGVQTCKKSTLALAVLVALTDSFRAVLYSYLRFGMFFPFLAVLLGAVIGARSLRILRSPVLLPIALAGVIMAPYVGVFAQTRQNLPRGWDRLTELATMQPETDQTSGWIATLARSATFNQTTQVMALADREGFRKGETLSYMSYAFIPRILWPTKPTIAQGQWFAEKVGFGYVIRDTGSFSNSINMTLPGELYLNFGWPGTIVGCFLAGGFMALLWNLCGFWTRPTDILCTVLGFRLLWGATVLLGDIQQIVSLTAYYLVFVIVGWALGGRRVGAEEDSVPAGRRRTAAQRRFLIKAGPP